MRSADQLPVAQPHVFLLHNNPEPQGQYSESCACLASDVPILKALQRGDELVKLNNNTLDDTPYSIADELMFLVCIAGAALFGE